MDHEVYNRFSPTEFIFALSQLETRLKPEFFASIFPKWKADHLWMKFVSPQVDYNLLRFIRLLDFQTRIRFLTHVVEDVANIDY